MKKRTSRHAIIKEENSLERDADEADELSAVNLNEEQKEGGEDDNKEANSSVLPVLTLNGNTQLKQSTSMRFK